MIIYDSRNVYYGDVKDNVREGRGINFLLTEETPELGYYYYDGEWDNDLPNGSGISMEMKVLTDEDGNTYISKTQTEGNYKDAVENGRMLKKFYVQGEDTKRLIYTAQDGIPLPLTKGNDQPVPTSQAGCYVIGILSMENETTKEYYLVEPQTIWGVIPFMNDN